MNGLPRWHHPIFNWDRFARATNDGFFLAIEARDVTPADRLGLGERPPDLGDVHPEEILLTLEELADLGYSAVLYPVTLLRVAMKACEAALNLIAADGTQQDLLDLMQTREELYDLLDYKFFEERDRAHAKAPMTND